MHDSVSAHRRVVKRLINCPVESIAVVADGKCFRKHEAYTGWDTRDTTRSPILRGRSGLYGPSVSRFPCNARQGKGWQIRIPSRRCGIAGK